MYNNWYWQFLVWNFLNFFPKFILDLYNKDLVNYICMFFIHLILMEIRITNAEEKIPIAFNPL